jgi:hypothetical protein
VGIYGVTALVRRRRAARVPAAPAG